MISQQVQVLHGAGARSVRPHLIRCCRSSTGRLQSAVTIRCASAVGGDTFRGRVGAITASGFEM
jgi:hypothetical protein